ncbi:MAG TPA: hypothetical protein VN894_00695 [Polyangiaceae bacterium]|nr:hypothetical protein [Polyangiaceae bacterium]
MMRPRLALIVATSFIACAGTAKREASILVAAIDRYRRADSTSKPAEARTVAAVACTDAKVCVAKRACLAALDPTARALALKDEVARRIADLQKKRLAPDSPEAQALPGKLDEAEKLLREGRTKMPDCEKQLTDLQVEYGV